MKHCPNPDCSHLHRFGRIGEFRDDWSECSDCGTTLAWGDAPEAAPPQFRDLVTIYEAPDSIRGHLLRGILEDQEIPTVVIGDRLAGALGELPATVLNVRVQVPLEFAAQATEIASAFDRGEFET